jgi:DNA-binding transcriptional MocR family regulator
VDREIAATLGELERKLQELERALRAIGERDQDRDGSPASTTPTAADAHRRAPEVIAAEPLQAQDAAESPSYPPRGVSGRGFGDPLAATAPGQAGYARPPAPDYRGRLVDEAVEPPAGVMPPASEPLSGPPAGARVRADPSFGAAPTAGELLRFREHLERTARELTHDYDELLARLRPPEPPPLGGTISFARGAPSLDIIDVQGLRDAAVRAFESDPGGATAYGTSVGYPRLRAWIADRHGVEPERVLVTNGSMQADAFLFEALLRAGDEVVVERPTYDRTLLSLRELQTLVHAIELQADGIDTQALAGLLGARRGSRPKLAHIIPNFQNPAGYTLSLAKRQALLALAAQYGFTVFEDDPYVALRFAGESLPTMLSMDPQRVVYASSFSKTVCPGIRVGYLVGPHELIEAIAKRATNTYISPNMVSQAIVYEFCASGAIERSIETVRRALAERAATLAAALRRELPDAEFVSPQGGYFMWVRLPGADVHALHRAAGELGVAFVEGRDFMLEGGEDSFRLAYAGVTPEQIEEGVRRLAAAYRSPGIYGP